jgi:hypothetical protein
MRTTGVLPTVPRMLSNLAMGSSAGFGEFRRADKHSGRRSYSLVAAVTRS